MNDGRLQYARNGDARLAYRLLGKGDTTLVFLLGWVVCSIDTFEHPGSPYASSVEMFARHTRVLILDRRGTGLSDPTTDVSIEERVEDLRAVLDAAGVHRAVLWGGGGAGPISILFAVRYPRRVSALVLPVTAARFSQALPDHPWGFTDEDIEAQLREIDSDWGYGALSDIFFGAAAAIPGVREEFGRQQRAVSSPTLARSLWKATMETDVRDELPNVQVPTLVMARPGDRFVPFEASAALAAAIPGARLHELPAGNHSCFDITDILARETLRFVCGTYGSGPSARVLATTLFTDIVGSTELVSAYGDAHWRHRLAIHDDIVGNLLTTYGGHSAKHTGDGVFALFDSPTNALRCALELAATLATRGLSIRAGVHTGEVERRGDEWSGLAIHIASRLVEIAKPGEVTASRTVRDLTAGSDLVFHHIGLRRLKGVSEEVRIYRIRAGGRNEQGGSHADAIPQAGVCATATMVGPSRSAG
ncbi:adenylate/guanylate cyclase domain-containing protein [Mycobacterium asiaticum]|uniref:Hydrolase n=1 Tax=Mycobacterium asiaticum TaxID=1790 RepID=A0A1A3MTU0_MYCAS|nr:adenylate/guanylate cyclase domain-containing protein [Mycobacterium asiaticum]OBK13333.1 hydrolase [Mycobacterium asiaticum]